MAISVIPVALAMMAAATTYVGGRVALRLDGRVALLFGLTAGVVLGIALFDLLPEAFGLGVDLYSPRTLLAALATGLAIYMLLDRVIIAGIGTASFRPHLGPASLTAHSFIDGMGIGLAFHVSAAAGIVIAVAVLAHDFADGINTVGLTIAGNRRDIAHRWLVADSLAPVAGAVVGTVIHLGHGALALVLAGFAGAFLYIGACELVPRSYIGRNRAAPTLATLCGMLAIYGVVHIAR